MNEFGDNAPSKTQNSIPTLKEVSELSQVVNTAVDTLRSLTFSYLLVGTYIAITAGAVSDRSLLIGTDIQLPLLGVSVGLTGFFWLSPLLFVVLHGNLLYICIWLLNGRTCLKPRWPHCPSPPAFRHAARSLRSHLSNGKPIRIWGNLGH